MSNLRRIIVLIATVMTAVIAVAQESILSPKEINAIRTKKTWTEVNKILSQRGWIVDAPETLEDKNVTVHTWHLSRSWTLRLEKTWKAKRELSIVGPADDYSSAFIEENIKGYKPQAQTKTKTFFRKKDELILSRVLDQNRREFTFSTRDADYWRMLEKTGRDPDIRMLDSYQIGDYIEEEGGILFYVSDDYSYGYILAMTDAAKGSGCEWGCDGVDLTSNYPYTTKEWHEANYDYAGDANTVAINAYLETEHSLSQRAAQLAATYDGGGQTDWYLPSVGQLRIIKELLDRLNQRLRNNGGTSIAKSWYWSSTEYDATFAWAVDFKNGMIGRSTKKGMDRVRPVRTIRISED